MATKKTVIPPIVSTRDVGKEPDSKSSKKTTSASKTTSSKASGTSLIDALNQTEQTIRELTQKLLETEESKHRTVGGQYKLTPKQMLIQKEITDAKRRYDQILKIIDNAYL